MVAAYSPLERLSERRNSWAVKPVLREIYRDMFSRISAQMIPGTTLEVGGGSGMSKEFLSGIVATDIVPTPWIDVAADCQALPFSSSSFANLVLLDVLHHVPNVPAFFREAARVLFSGGRLILVEPAMTAISRPLYRWFHAEPVDMDADPFEAQRPGGHPFDANQAVPTLIFGKYRHQLRKEFPQFDVKLMHHFALWAYPLSGGFQSWSFLPSPLAGPILRLEASLEPIIGRIAGFRLLVTLERT